MNDYATYRNTIRSGDLLAWSHRRFRTWHDFKIAIVRMATRSEYSHVGVAWVIGGRVFVIEAVEPMARIYPLGKLGDFYHCPLAVDWDDRIEEAAIGHVGAEYRQLEAIRLYFAAREAGNVSECAALVLEILMSAGINLGTRATPDAVVRAAQQLGNPLYLIQNGQE